MNDRRSEPVAGPVADGSSAPVPGDRAAGSVTGDRAVQPVTVGSAAAPPTRRLILLRHAKSAYPDGVADHDRPLAPRGRREAALAGAWLAADQPPIDAVLCSDAIRARQTLQHSHIDAPVTVEPGLYGASAGEVIAAAAAMAPEARTVLMVAHAPGLPQAAEVLAGDGSDRAALAALRAGFGTSAIAVLAVDGPWSALGPSTCRLLTVHTPRG